MTTEESQALRQQISSGIDSLADPVDYSDLEKRGIISKVGAWYRVYVPVPDLPERIRKRISCVATDLKGVKVKFVSESKIQRSVKKLKKMGL